MRNQLNRYRETQQTICPLTTTKKLILTIDQALKVLESSEDLIERSIKKEVVTSLCYESIRCINPDLSIETQQSLIKIFYLLMEGVIKYERGELSSLHNERAATAKLKQLLNIGD